MPDPTEAIRRQRLAEINGEPGSREALKPSTVKCGTRPNLLVTLLLSDFCPRWSP